MGIRLAVISSVVLTLLQDAGTSNVVTRLHNKIFSAWESDARPVSNYTDVISIGFRPIFRSADIIDIGQQAATAELGGWHVYFFNVPVFSWNPDEFENIKKVTVPRQKIWMPDWILINSAHVNMQENMNPLVEVHSNGDVLFYPMARNTIKCRIQPKEIDTYKCAMVYGSWMYGAERVDAYFLEDAYVDDDLNLEAYPSDYIVRNATTERRLKSYATDPETYVYLIYRFTLTRQPTPQRG